MTVIEGPIRSIVKIGLLDVILPFILVFTITFGILERTKVLGKENRKANIMISASLGLVSVLAVNVLKVMNTLVRYLALLIVMGVLLAIVFGMAGAQFKKPHKMVAALLAILFGITVFYALAEAGAIDKQRFLNTILLPLIILTALVATIIYVLKGQKEEKAEPAVEKKPETMLQKPEQPLSWMREP